MTTLLEPPKPSPDAPLTLMELRVMELQYREQPIICQLVVQAITRRMAGGVEVPI